MKAIWIVWILFGSLILTGISGYSQNTYPKKLIINGDTIIALKPIHLIKANQSLLSGRMYKRENNILRDKILSYSTLLAALKEKEKTNQQLLLNYEMQIHLLNQKNTEQAEALLKQKRKEKRRSFFTGTAIGATLTIVALIFISI